MMTKEQIKKGLKICILGDCGGCPYVGFDFGCRDKLEKDALALITEQGKEIERLKAQQREIDRLTQVAQEAQTEAYEACQKQFIEQVNQAKIDAFNKLKEKIVERMGDREYMGVKYKQGVFSESEIDEMIAEVQNAEDKS